MLKKILSNEKRVVLLGGGFISSEFAKLLKKKNKKVLLINRKKIDFLKKNSVNKIDKIIKDTDIVFIIAAEAPVKTVKMFSNNIIILKNILLGIEKKNLHKVIYLSSDAVYNDSMNPLNEKSKTETSNLHGMMHISREKILNNYYNDRLLIFRSTLVYGVNDPHNGYGPNQFIRSAKKNKLIKLFGKGEEKRDHIWVNDLTEMMYEIIYNNKKNILGILNLASGKIISFSEIATLIKKNISKVNISNLERKIPPPHNGYRPIDITKFNKFSKFKPKSFSIVLRKIIQNYKEM